MSNVLRNHCLRQQIHCLQSFVGNNASVYEWNGPIISCVAIVNFRSDIGYLILLKTKFYLIEKRNDYCVLYEYFVS